MRQSDFAPQRHDGYHSAEEVDEEVGSWRDWAGPALAVLFFLGAVLALILVGTGIA